MLLNNENMLNRRYTQEQANKFLRLNLIDKIKLTLINSKLKKHALIYNQDYIEMIFKISVGLQDFLESLGYNITYNWYTRIWFNNKPKEDTTVKFEVDKKRTDLIARMEMLNTLQDDDIGEFSDGYHTFNELYDFRLQYNAAMANLLHYTKQCTVYKSRKHSDGELCFGGSWFVVYIITPFGQISNHYHMENWDYFDIPEREMAEEWDGHSPEDVLVRLKKFNSPFDTMIHKNLESIINKEEQNGNQDIKD